MNDRLRESCVIMKKKMKWPFIIVACLLLLTIPITPSFADSGFDGSYDSSSSSSDWSSSSSSSSSSSWSDSSSSYDSWSSSSSSSSSHSSSGDSSLDSAFSILAFIAFIAVYFAPAVAIYIFGNMRTSKKNRDNLYNPDNMRTISSLGKEMTPYDANQVKKYLFDYDEEEFKKQAYELYREIQRAWMNFENLSLRRCTTDALDAAYYGQLAILKTKKQQNIMRDFELRNIQITGMEIKEGFISLGVKMTVVCFDYIIDDKYKTIRGNDKLPVMYEYFMVFNKGFSERPNTCPNCGAPLENLTSVVCPYCRSQIINNNYEWVLAKKQVLAQTENFKRD